MGATGAAINENGWYRVDIAASTLTEKNHSVLSDRSIALCILLVCKVKFISGNETVSSEHFNFRRSGISEDVCFRSKKCCTSTEMFSLDIILPIRY
jgi:hypothetical protein